MKLYFAGAGIPRKDMDEFRKTKYENGEIFRFLHSYLEVKNRNFDMLKNHIHQEDQMFLDSGAYTAMTQGTTIDIDDYISLIKESGVKLYANLDVIGDWKKTNENQEYMESKGLTPIPTFHYRSPYSELERLIKNYKYIALGGLVPIAMRRPLFESWVDGCFSIIQNKVKVHGFGVNSFWAWKRYPFYSVDATTWVTGSKFRRIVKFEKYKLKIFQKNDIKDYGTMQVYANHYVSLNCGNMEEYQKAALFVTELWKSRGVEFPN